MEGKAAINLCHSTTKKSEAYALLTSKINKTDMVIHYNHYKAIHAAGNREAPQKTSGGFSPESPNFHQGAVQTNPATPKAPETASKTANNLFSPSSCAGNFSWDQPKKVHRLIDSLFHDECPRRSAEGCWKMFRIPSLTPFNR